MDETTDRIAKPAALRAQAMPGRFHWLDFFRFMAAITVVLHHYYLFFFDGTELTMNSAEMAALSPFAAMKFFYDYGQFAVQFFWVLSGFVFAHTYFTRPSDGIGYATARFARLYPLHFATLAAVGALQIISLQVTGTNQITANNDAYHFMLQVFFVSAWGFEAGDSFNAPIWSVSAEIGVYIVFFFLCRNALFRTAGGQVLAIAGAIAASWFMEARQVPVCAAFFFSGCLAYLLVRDRRPMDFALAGVAALCVMRLMDGPMAMAMCGFALAVLAVAWLDVAGLPGGRRLGHLGDFTYSIYLLHMPLILTVLIVFDAAGADIRDFLSSPVMLTAYVGTAIAASAVCYHYFERPADRALRAWVKQRRVSAATATGKVHTA